MPEKPAALWAFIRGLSENERMVLLAHCVSLTANAIRVPRRVTDGRDAHAAVLREVNLDMAAYWKPTTAGYFGRVSKERIVQAVREAVSEQKVAGLKKQAMAEVARAALAGKNWLPAVLYGELNQGAV